MPVDANLQRNDRPFRRERDTGLFAPIDDRMRQMEGETEHARLVHRIGNGQEIAEQFRDTRANPVDNADRRKKRIENRRTHVAHL